MFMGLFLYSAQDSHAHVAWSMMSEHQFTGKIHHSGSHNYLQQINPTTPIKGFS
jgi:hypothetical protein